MQKSSLKLYFTTFILTMSLASFALAGDGHCPFTDAPPPGDGELVTAPVIVNTTPSVNGTYQFLKGFWEVLTQSSDLF